MGCASSSYSAAKLTGRLGKGLSHASAASTSASSNDHDAASPVLSASPLHLLSGPRRLSMRPHSLETRILQIDQVDTVLLEPTNSSEPEVPFVDGQLGLRDLSPSSMPKGAPFCDADFPTDMLPGVRWLRPPELGAAGAPLWTGDCAGRLRVGSFDDRWLAEAIAIVAQRPQLLDRVFDAEVPAGVQGACRVRLWRFGRWETVLVDDRLPVPLCITSDAAGEVWPALLEKAFAKVHGGYAGLGGGDVLWGLEDLTGGVAQRLHVHAGGDLHGHREPAPAAAAGGGGGGGPGPRASLYLVLYRPLVQALRIGALVSCTPLAMQNHDHEVHVSTVVDTKLTIRGPQVCVQDDSKSVLNQWMDLENFAASYTNIIVTTLDTGSDHLQVQEIFGWWETGVSAGGSRNNLEKFATNPQYSLTITQPDEEEENKDFGRCSLLLALMQEHRRSARACRPPLLPIACFIYKADTVGERLSAEYFLCVPEEVGTGPFVNKREVAHRAELEPGNYVIVPATWSAGYQGSFLLRICALRKITFKALPPYKPICAMLPTWVPATEI